MTTKRSAPDAPIPERYEGALSAYLSGSGSRAQVLELYALSRQPRGVWVKPPWFFVRRLPHGDGPLGAAEARLLDVCAEVGGTESYLEEMRRAGREDCLAEVYTYIAARGLDEQGVLEYIARHLEGAEGAVDTDGCATAFGRSLLAVLPNHLDALIQYVAEHWHYRASEGLVRLLLAANPPYVDAALRVAQRAQPFDIDDCTLPLLETAPDQARAWAREVAGPQSPARIDGRRAVLAWLLRTDARGNLDLAFDALHASDTELACLGVEAIYRADPTHGLAVVEETALRARSRLGVWAVGLLQDTEQPDVRAALQRCARAARAPAARLKAMDLLHPHLQTPDAVMEEAQLALKWSRPRADAALMAVDACELRWVTGDPMPPIAVRYLLYRQSQARGQDSALDARARQILALVDRASAGDFARALFDAWLSQGAPAHGSWCLPLVCVLADTRLLNIILDDVRHFEWAWAGRKAGRNIWMTQRALRAMALVDDESILSQVGDIANGVDRIDRNRHPSIVQAALVTLQVAAQRLRIPYEELLDRAATRPSWDASRTWTFDFGGHVYTAQFNSDLRWHIRDDADKRLRAIPKPGPASDLKRAGQAYTQWNTRWRQLRLAIRTQAIRLERALATERTWSVAAWRKIFLRHPLMRLLATNLIWVVGDTDGDAERDTQGDMGRAGSAAPLTFRPTDDGTLVTADGHAVDLPAEGAVWLVHPLRIDDELRQAWIRNLTRAHRHPPFRQMDRPVTRVRPEERDLLVWMRDAGNRVFWRTLYRRGDALGWDTVSFFRAGSSPTIMRKTIPWKRSDKEAPQGLEARLETTIERGMMRIERLTFWRVTLSACSPYRVLTDPKYASNLRLSEVPPIVLSEVAFDVARMIGGRRVDH